MAESKYEKYVVRHPFHPDPKIYAPGVPPIRFLEGGKGTTIKTDYMVEYSWAVKDLALGMSPTRGGAQEHDFDEIFVFIGTNQENTDDLGGEVEFWIGKGEETEKIKLNTSSLIYVPGGVAHMPIFFRNVKRPILYLVMGVNVGEMKVTRFWFKRAINSAYL